MLCVMMEQGHDGAEPQGSGKQQRWDPAAPPGLTLDSRVPEVPPLPAVPQLGLTSAHGPWETLSTKLQWQPLPQAAEASPCSPRDLDR